MKNRPAPKKTQVFVVDRCCMIRLGLMTLIEAQSNYKVCAEAPSPEEALQKIKSGIAPDLLITDLEFPDGCGLEFIKDLRRRRYAFPILTVAAWDEMVYAERALHAGAQGYLMKMESGEKIIQAIQTVLRGKVFLSEAAQAKVLEDVARGGAAHHGVEILSDRELEVLRLIGRGFKPHEIAESLHLSIKTVESYRAQIKTKLHLGSAAELTHYAIAWSHESNSHPSSALSAP